MCVLAVQYWGKRGAGPKFVKYLSHELANCSVKFVVSVSGRMDSGVGDLGNVVVERVQVPHETADWHLLLKLPLVLIRHIRFLKTHDVSTVFCPMISPFVVFLAPLYRCLGYKFVVIAHDANRHPGESSKLLQLVDYVPLIFANPIFTLSLSVKTSLRKIFFISDTKEIVVFKHGPFGSVRDYHSAKVCREKTFLFIGRILEYKGLAQFVDAVLLIESRGFEIFGKIVGEGFIPSNLREKIEACDALQLKLGWVTDSEFEDHISKSYSVVLPYQEASQSGVIEYAIPLGIPIIVTPVGGLSEQVRHGETGLICEGITAEAVADQMEILASSDYLWETISKNQIDQAKYDDSWYLMVEKLTTESARGPS